MNVDDYRQFLLTTLPNARSAAGGREVITNCPFCDKEKHFYIGMPTNDKPSMYNCFKCGESGIVTPELLNRFDVFNPEVGNYLKDTTKEQNKNIRYDKKFHSYYLANPVPMYNELNLRKLQYINNRLGTNLSLEEIASNKIVLNLYDLLNYNRVSSLTRHPRIVQDMNDYFIGFLSMDNAYVNLRKITKKDLHESINKRYINYNIPGSLDNLRRYYLIPCSIDTLQPIIIHIAEGPFDILSVKYNLRYNVPNSIFIAGCGKSYINIIKLLIEDLGLIDMEIHIYMDNDDDPSKITRIPKYLLRPFGYPFYVHNNIYPGEKDFGVPLNRINEQVVRIC